MNKEELINDICDMTNTGNKTAAAGCIEQSIDKHAKFTLDNFKAEILNIIDKGTPNRGRTHKKWEQKIIKLCGGEVDD